MKDRVPGSPGRVLITPEGGGAAFYATMARADNPIQEGDPLNKATLLTDETAALFGLSPSAVPNDVFGWLGKYTLHWWARYNKTAPYYTLGDLVSTQENIEASFDIYYGTSLSVADDGTLSISNGTATTLASGDNLTLSNNYVRITSSGKNYFYYLESGGTVGYYSSSKVKLENHRAVTGHRAVYDFVDYVYSSNRNAYPDNGVSGDYRYDYCGVPSENAVTASKIVTGSYVGTGTAGTNNPTSLTFNFTPSLVIVRLYSMRIASQYSKEELMVYIYGAEQETVSSGSFTDGLVRFYSVSGNTLSWWVDGTSASNQMNESGVTYHYIAIG